MNPREIDALVAEKVMGWSRYHDGAWLTAEELPDHGGFRIISGSWSPSTDIAAAWQVVERMRFLGWRMCSYVNPDETAAIRYCVDYHLPYRPTAGYCHNNESMPAAICLAALRALGIPIEGGQ